MTPSKMIAGLIGPTLIAIALALFLNLGSFPAMVEQISRDPALIFLSGILLFVAGLAIVRAHNIWSGGWPVLVTVLGWLALLGGLGRMFFPIRLASVAAQFGRIHGRDRSSLIPQCECPATRARLIRSSCALGKGIEAWSSSIHVSAASPKLALAGGS